MSAEAIHPSSQPFDQEAGEPEEEKLEWLTPPHRCDQCGSQSYYMIALKKGELFLCYHHYNAHEERLFDVAEDIVDESELLHKNV